MCGIVGYTGGRPALPLLLEGLRRLEYRGYDSAGVALATVGGITVAKRAGRLTALAQAVTTIDTAATAGIAHTRWATHGAATDLNAHPHTDTSERIALVHNGIISNEATLRAELRAAGVTLRSATDSELIAHLIAAAYTGDLAAAVRRVTGRLEGQWALAVTHADTPELLVATVHGAPLAVGLGAGEQWLVSDPVALAGASEQVLFLADDELVELRPAGVQHFDATGVEQPLRPVHVRTAPDAPLRDAQSSRFEQEAAEQPAVLQAILAGRIEGDRIHLAELDPLAPTVATLEGIDFVACGSSYYATAAAAALAERLLAIPVRTHVASEFRYSPPLLGPRRLVIAVSQSGETADTIAAIRVARAADAPVIACVNAEGSTLARDRALTVVALRAGSERSVAATKSYLAQGLTTLLLILDLATRRGALPTGWIDDLQALPAQVATLLATIERVDALAPTYARSRGFAFVGRGAGLAAACEGALKTKELAYLPAEAYPAGELKHGPIALLDAEHPVVAVLLDDAARSVFAGNLAEIQARGARLLLIGSAPLPPADDLVLLPASRPELQALLAVVVLQRFAFAVARHAGREIDFPRNLAKAVTVE